MNGASSSEFYINAVTNNSFTLANAEETIKHSIYNSFAYLDKLQKEKIGLYRGSFTSDDLKTFDCYKKKVRLVVPKDLIDASIRDRYRLGKFYQKEITLKDISDNQDVFIHMPLVFLNGLNTVNFTVKAYESHTEIYFDKTDALMSCDDIAVMFVLNDGIISTQTNKYVFADSANKLPLTLFGKDVDFNSTGLTTITDISSMTGSSFNYTTFEDNSVAIDLSANAESIIANNRRVSVSVILTRYMHTMEDILVAHASGETVTIKPFIITDDNGDAFRMPIPVENIVISKYDSTIGDFRIDSSITVKRTYPFIYDIVDANAVDGDMYQVIYFYYPTNTSYSYTNFLKYSYLLALQTTGHTNIIDLVIAIRNGECSKFDYLLTYVPPDYDYSIPDFNEDANHPYHFDYKIDKLGDFIKSNPWVLADYVSNQSMVNMFFEIDVTKIDLSSRLRNDTRSEATRVENKFDFDEPCYVFAIFMGDTEKYDKIFYVDGIFCDHKYSFREHDMEYVYIPASVVTANSIIEVERFDSFSYEKTLTLNSTSDVVDLDIVGNSRSHSLPITNDIIVMTEAGEIVDKPSHFTMNVTDNDLVYDVAQYPLSPVKKISLSMKDEHYQGVQLKIIVDKDHSNTACPTNANEIFVSYVPQIFFIKKNHIRVFVNNKIIRTDLYDIVYDVSSANYIFYLLKPAIEDMTVIIQILPVSYSCVYSQATIPEDGLIDFTGKLNKPFSSLYYDVFVNGRKLTEGQIRQITPMKVRFIGLKSLKNLEIYEKDRNSTEYFGDLVNFKDSYTTMKTLEETIIDGDTFTSDEKTQLENIIRYDKYGSYDNVPNTDTETDNLETLIDIGSLPIAKFTLNNIIGSTSIDPNVRQLDESIFDAGVGDEIAAWLDSDSESDGTTKNVVTLNPDVCLDTAVAAQSITSDREVTQKRIIDF